MKKATILAVLVLLVVLAPLVVQAQPSFNFVPLCNPAGHEVSVPAPVVNLLLNAGWTRPPCGPQPTPDDPTPVDPSVELVVTVDPKDRPQPAYLIAVIGDGGASFWSLNGDVVRYDNGEVITTPGQTILFEGRNVQVTVLILSEYVHPDDAVAYDSNGQPLNGVYADYAAYTCAAYNGSLAYCPGVWIVK
jgi:hypothetical protein